MQLKANGIVLRDYKTQEDRLLTILTDRYGVVTAYANGANRVRSRLAASTEMLCYSELVLFRNRDRYTVDKADSKRIFFGIRADLDKLSLASYFAELTSELAPRGEEAGTYLRLLLNTLHLLEAGSRPPGQLKPLYELRLLTLSGYMPNLVACRSCGCYESGSIYFLPATGEICCGDCFDGVSGVAVGPGALAAMRHIVYSAPDKLFGFALADASIDTLARITETYLLSQLEKTFSTLEFYRTLSASGGRRADEKEDIS